MTAILAMPIVIAAMALVPALMICPFLTAAHQRQVIRLLAGLRDWTAALVTFGDASSEGRRPP